MSDNNASLWKRARRWAGEFSVAHRSSRAGIPSGRGGNVKEIILEDFYKIFEYDNSEAVSEAMRLENEFEKKQYSKDDANYPKSNANHPKNELVWRVVRRSIGEHIYIPERAYIEHITKKSREHGIEEHIIIEEMPEGMFISIDEPKSYYCVKYKITIKNLTIKVGGSDLSLTLGFDKMKEKIQNQSFMNKGGICFIFERNSFELSSPDAIICDMSWSLGENRYLIFENNEFKSLSMNIATEEESLEVESLVVLKCNHFNNALFKSPNKGISIQGGAIRIMLEGNYFESVPLKIMGIPDRKSGYQIIDNTWYFSSGKKRLARRMEEKVNKHIKDIEDKIKEEESEASIKDILKMLLYMNKKITVYPDDLEYRGESIVQLKKNRFFRLEIASHRCYFSGRNIINRLEISKGVKYLRYLYWEPYQNIDPQGEHAHEHKQIFIKLIERAAQNNDKTLEAKLRRELLKCERVLISKEKTLSSIQDVIILEWSRLVSNYGISWFRPIAGLLVINVFLSIIVYCLFEHESSWDLLLVLFFEFFNPFSGLSEVTKINDNGWIAFINIVQKAFLALFVYEIIKIFRRFSK